MMLSFREFYNAWKDCNADQRKKLVNALDSSLRKRYVRLALLKDGYYDAEWEQEGKTNTFMS